jgi:hypothetical protein
MTALRPWQALGSLLAALVAASLLATGSASADATSKGCAAKPSQSAHPRISALRLFDDFIEDVATAPDICAANLITNDNESIMIAMHIHDRPDFAVGEVYSVVLDTDSNDATGGGVDTGPLAGAEFVIDLANDSASLRRWNGTAFEPATPQPEMFTDWIPAIGPFVIFSPADIGNAQTFEFTLMTSNGADADLAPDAGGWPYTVTPLVLTADRLNVGPARAGRPLVAVMRVMRSDFEVELDEGRITCAATVGGKRLAGKGSFVADHVGCAWKVPKTMRGKLLRGSVAVAYGGATAKRTFSVRVK